MTTYHKWENRIKNDATCTTATHYWEIENKDALVIPSLSFDAHELQSISGIGHYEGKTSNLIPPACYLLMKIFSIMCVVRRTNAVCPISSGKIQHASNLRHILPSGSRHPGVLYGSVASKRAARCTRTSHIHVCLRCRVS